jgi:CRP-like cAMP-binding protein
MSKSCSTRSIPTVRTPRHATPRAAMRCHLCCAGHQASLRLDSGRVRSTGSGYLDRDEVHELCKQLGGGIKKRHLASIMNQMKPTAASMDEDGTIDRGVSYEMFQAWWEDRNRKLNDLLVLPEGMIFSIREDAKSRKLLPSATTAEDMWHRLAVLLRLLADRQTIWGDPRLLYGQSEQKAKQEVEGPKAGAAGLKDKLNAIARQKEDAARFRRCFLRPNSPMRQIWDGSQVFLLLYVFITVPYRTCFMIPTPQLLTSWFWVELFVDVYFVVDIVMNFRTAFYDGRTGELIINDGDIARNYLSTWFAIDFVSCLPISYIELIGEAMKDSATGDGAGGQFKALKILRMLRMAKMLRIFRMKKILQRYREQLEPLLDYLRIFVLTLVIFLCAHLVGCMWYYFGTMVEEDEDGIVIKTGWIHHEESFRTTQCGRTCGEPGSDDYNATCTDECYAPEDVDEWHAYVAALYWAITTVSTVGYGDIIAWTEYERIFSFFATMLGVMVFGMISGALSSILMTQKGAVLQYHQRMDEIRQFLKAKNVPTSTRRQVVAFYNNLWSEQAVYDEAEIMNQLPSSLNHELITFLYQDMIASVALFHNMDQEVIQNICQHLRHTVILRDMFVIQEGQVGKEMYIIETGEVEALVRSKKLCKHQSNQMCEHCIRLGRQGPKSFFGELAVMGVGDWQRRKRSVRAMHELVHLSSLSKDSIDKLRADYPQLNQALFQVATTVRCEGMDSITNIHASKEPASKQDVQNLDRKIMRLERMMERALLKLDPDGETIPTPQSTTGLAQTDSSNLYTPGGSTDWSKVRCEKRHFLSHLYIKMLILPRQARDKHRENSKKGPFSCRAVRLDEGDDDDEDVTTLGDPRGSGLGGGGGGGGPRSSHRSIMAASGLTEIDPQTPRERASAAAGSAGPASASRSSRRSSSRGSGGGGRGGPVSPPNTAQQAAAARLSASATRAQPPPTPTSFSSPRP